MNKDKSVRFANDTDLNRKPSLDKQLKGSKNQLVQELTQNQQSSSGVSSTMEFMRQAVSNLNNRVNEIEGKIKNVSGMLEGQKSIIREQVKEEKQNWL